MVAFAGTGSATLPMFTEIDQVPIPNRFPFPLPYGEDYGEGAA